MLGVVEPSLPSPSLFRGIVEDLKRGKGYNGFVWEWNQPVHILG